MLSRFICVYFGCISQGAAGGALAAWWWHHSRRRGGCSHILTACIQATSLKGTLRNTSHLQGCAGGALVGCYEPTCQMLLFPYTPYYSTWVRPLPPRATSRLSGLARCLRCSSPNSVLATYQADFGQGLGPPSKCPITNHQPPMTDGQSPTTNDR